MAMQMQSLLVNPMSRLANGSGMTRMSMPARFMPHLEKRVGLRVNCMAKGEPKSDGKTEVTSSIPSSAASSPTPTSTPTPAPQKKAKTGFIDVLAFSGPGPERINGRLAMIGFTAALAVELSKGTDLFSQISDGGAQWFLGTSILLSVASLVPLLKGVNPESKTEGLMNSNAELWNGRLAMLGLVALAFTEYVIGGALV